MTFNNCSIFGFTLRKGMVWYSDPVLTSSLAEEKCGTITVAWHTKEEYALEDH